MPEIVAYLRRDGPAKGFLGASLPSHNPVWASGPVVLQYVPFAVARADPPAAPQIGAAGRFVLLWDGRLDNREELGQQLGLAGEREAFSDAALAMRAWERWQSDALAELDGDFSLVVWDDAEKRLFAARDQLGMGSLCYHETPARLIVGSAPRLIHAFGDVARELDLEHLASELSGSRQTSSASVFRGITWLPPAGFLVADGRASRVERYWSIDLDAPELRLPSPEDYVAQGRALLDRAVRVRMRSTGKICADLTGGLDSSAVAATALEHLGGQKRLPVFTHLPEPGWDGRVEAGRYGDESPYVRDIVEMHPRMEPYSIRSTGYAWDHGLNDFFASAELAPSLPCWLSTWEQTFRAAKAAGAGVVLNGASGNLTLSWEGRGAFAEWTRNGELLTLLRELALIAPGPVAFARAVASRVLVPLGPDWAWKLYARLKYGDLGRMSREDYSLANPSLLTHRDAEPDIISAVDRLRPRASYRALRAEMLVPDHGAPGAEIARAARANYGVDYRSPLHDRRLIEWCLRIPDSQFWRDGKPRSLMRRIMAGRLPASVLGNRKRGAPGSDWHLQMTRQLPAIREQIEVLSADPEVAALVDFPRIARLLDQWPEHTPVDEGDPRGYLLSVALPHALAVGRFIRWAKGANL